MVDSFGFVSWFNTAALRTITQKIDHIIYIGWRFIK